MSILLKPETLRCSEASLPEPCTPWSKCKSIPTHPVDPAMPTSPSNFQFMQPPLDVQLHDSALLRFLRGPKAHGSGAPVSGEWWVVSGLWLVVCGWEAVDGFVGGFCW